jgi:hypothetical protein
MGPCKTVPAACPQSVPIKVTALSSQRCRNDFRLFFTAHSVAFLTSGSRREIKFGRGPAALGNGAGSVSPAMARAGLRAGRGGRYLL